MTWLIWRQHRGEALVAGLALTLLAALLLVTGLAIGATYQQLGVGDCLGAAPAAHCVDALAAFHQATGFWRGATLWFAFVPMILAMLVGAPLVAREYERGTFRLVWTQGVPRARWLGRKLALVVGGSLVLAAVMTVLLTWWRIPFARVSSDLDPQQFDVEGTVPLAYMAYALALAIAAGTLLRRTVPAMAVTVAGFLVVRFPVELLARPHYLPSVTATWDPYLQTAAAQPGPHDWVFDGNWLDAAGRVVDDTRITGACTSDTVHYNLEPGTAFTQCTHAHGWLVQLVWQPGDRFWLFQGVETAIFAGLAALLLALTVWWVRRRLA
jgi:hypothetical protein